MDDNFIGKRQQLKNELLPAIIEWMDKRKYPFTFNTQTSIDLVDDEELMTLMTRAGFNCVFRDARECLLNNHVIKRT